MKQNEITYFVAVDNQNVFFELLLNVKPQKYSIESLDLQIGSASLKIA